jgi:hypothetical protein
MVLCPLRSVKIALCHLWLIESQIHRFCYLIKSGIFLNPCSMRSSNLFGNGSLHCTGTRDLARFPLVGERLCHSGCTVRDPVSPLRLPACTATARPLSAGNPEILMRRRRTDDHFIHPVMVMTSYWPKLPWDPPLRTP